MAQHHASAAPAPPVDISHHFSAITVARTANQIKKFYKYFQIPGIGNTAGGSLAPLFLLQS